MELALSVLKIQYAGLSSTLCRRDLDGRPKRGRAVRHDTSSRRVEAVVKA